MCPFLHWATGGRQRQPQEQVTRAKKASLFNNWWEDARRKSISAINYLSTSPSISLSSPVKPASHSSSSSLLLFFRDTVDTALKNSPKLLSSLPFVVSPPPRFSSFLESLLSMATGNRRAESTREERKPGTKDLRQKQFGHEFKKKPLTHKVRAGKNGTTSKSKPPLPHYGTRFSSQQGVPCLKAVCQNMRPWGGLFCLHWKLVGHWVEGSAPSWKGGSGAGHWVQLGGSRGGPSGPSGWKWPRWRKSHLSKSHASRCHATPVQFFAITNIATF